MNESMERNETMIILRERALNDEDFASLFMLYNCITHRKAVQLYQILYSLSYTMKQLKNDLLLCEMMCIDVHEMLACRKMLEQVELIKTYQNQQGNYKIILRPPLSRKAFLAHPLYGRLYISRMGNQMFELMNVMCGMQQVENEGYKEITTQYFVDDLKNWDDQQERHYQELLKEEQVKDSFQFDMTYFLKQLSFSVLPRCCRTDKNLKQILELARLYGMNEKSMAFDVGHSVRLSDQTLDFEILKKRLDRRYQNETKVEDPYLLSPVQFLRSKQRGVPITEADRRLIETLVNELKMPNEVINVLIEYVLNKTNQKLIRGFVEKVAGEWIRLKIDNKEKALAYVAQVKEEKIAKKNPASTRTLPDWYVNPLEDELSHDEVDMEEFNHYLNKIRGE